MKKVFLFTLLSSILFFFACETSQKEKEEIKALEQETEVLDSISTEITKSKESIDENIDELDQLINDLN